MAILISILARQIVEKLADMCIHYAARDFVTTNIISTAGMAHVEEVNKSVSVFVRLSTHRLFL